MKAEDKAECLAALASTSASLGRLTRSSEVEIESAAHAFKGLAAQAEAILKQAAAIVSCIEKESMKAMLSQVQSLSVTVRDFLARRLNAATTILEKLSQEEKLLRQLTEVTHRQDAIAHHLRALSVLTDMEVAHLGSAGGDFRLLAEELSAFSRLLSGQTLELGADTEKRKQAVAKTRHLLAASLPELSKEITRVEQDIESTLRAVEADLSQQAGIPEQFRQSAQETAGQIAGVVAAIQAHDISRQQIEHVQQALGLIGSRIEAAQKNGSETAQAYAGLTIQVGQVKTIKETVTSWTTQIKRCMEGIRQLSASEVTNIGLAVLNNEREMSGQLAHIELLQRKSHEYSGQMQNTLTGLSSLAELVEAHLKNSHAILGRLQFLMFNSLIEAHRLSKRGVVVSAIANLIKEVSREWNSITVQSRNALSEMLKLVQQTDQLMDIFSDASSQVLRDDQRQTRVALDEIRERAAFVAKEAEQMQRVTERMKADLRSISQTGDRLDACFGALDTAIAQIEAVSRCLTMDDPLAADRYDAAEVERIFSAFYTTQIERDVLRAALGGGELPVLQQTFAGNAVELF